MAHPIRWLRANASRIFVIAAISTTISGGSFGILYYVLENQDNIERKAIVSEKRATTAEKRVTNNRKLASDANRRSIQTVLYLQGKEGRPGLTGPRGVRGLRGLRGKQGERGPAVTRDELLFVLADYCATHECRGPQGLQGEPGPQGLPGAPPPNQFVVSGPGANGTTWTLTCTAPIGSRNYTCVPPPGGTAPSGPTP